MSVRSCHKNLALCSDSKKEDFWMNNVKELWQTGNYMKFVPSYEMTRTQQLNAITRFSIYFIILAIVFSKKDIWYYVPITLIALTVILYNVHKTDEQGKEKELDRILRIRKEKIERQRKDRDREYRHDAENPVTLDIDLKEEPDKKKYELQSGYIDSDGIYRLGGANPPGTFDKYGQESLYTIDELIDQQRNTCRRPTNENPFMNPDITEFNNGDIPISCNASDDEIRDDIMVKFNHDLFRDVDELWERANSQRQFYTMPNSSTPNNQVEFAKWLWGQTSNCKSDSGSLFCAPYEDLRARRNETLTNV